MSFSRTDCLLYLLNFLTGISHCGVWHLFTWQTLSGPGAESLGRVSSFASDSTQKPKSEKAEQWGLFPSRLLSQGHKLLSCFFVWGCLILIPVVSIITHSSDTSNTPSVRDWTLPWKYIVNRTELMESGTTKQGARTYTIWFRDNKCRERGFLGFQACTPKDTLALPHDDSPLSCVPIRPCKCVLLSWSNAQ